MYMPTIIGIHVTLDSLANEDPRIIDNMPLNVRRDGDGFRVSLGDTRWIVTNGGLTIRADQSGISTSVTGSDLASVLERAVARPVTLGPVFEDVLKFLLEEEGGVKLTLETFPRYGDDLIVVQDELKIALEHSASLTRQIFAVRCALAKVDQAQAVPPDLAEKIKVQLLGWSGQSGNEMAELIQKTLIDHSASDRAD